MKIHNKIKIFFLIGVVCLISFGNEKNPNLEISIYTLLSSSTTNSHEKIELTPANYLSDYVNTWGGNESDTAMDITLDASGNVYIAGSTYSFGAGDQDAFIAKYDSLGNSLLNITWGGSEVDSAAGITLDATGNIYITGTTYNFDKAEMDAFVAKFNSTGHSLMNITWGGMERDHGSDIELDASGNIYISGSTWSFSRGDYDAFIAKFNSTGHSLLNKTWGGTGGETGYDLELDSSGNIYISGRTLSFGWSAFVAKFNSSGHSLMNITWHDPTYAFGFGMVLDDIGNIYVTGNGYVRTGMGYDAFILKFNSTGDLKMTIFWGGNETDGGSEVVLDTAGNLFMIGATDSFGEGGYDVFIAKFNSTGHSLLNKTWGGSGDDWGMNMILDNQGNIFMTGYTESFGAGDNDAFIAKYTRDPDGDTGGIPGYNWLFLIGLLGITFIILAKLRNRIKINKV